MLPVAKRHKTMKMAKAFWPIERLSHQRRIGFWFLAEGKDLLLFLNDTL